MRRRSSRATMPRWRSSWRDRKSTRLNSSHTVISYAVFCLNTPSTALYTLSLHDALPIYYGKRDMPNLSRARDRCRWPHQLLTAESERELTAVIERVRPFIIDAATIISRHDASLALELERSEEHTSELQSHSDLVCRLLLEYTVDRSLHSFPTRRSSDLLWKA